MNQPELFDIVELLVDLSENLQTGVRGTIVERYGDDAYEVEFSDSDGETFSTLYSISQAIYHCLASRNKKLDIFIRANYRCGKKFRCS